VLVAGGDGCLNEVMNALAGTDMPVGIIPFGTVNVFAREMGIPLNPVEGARAFLAGQAEFFDLGCLGDRRFLLMVSYGFDVVALRHNPGLLKRLVGKYAYVLTGLVFFPFYDNRPIRVFLDDDETPIDAYFALFANSRLYAGSHVVARGADMQDGLLDVVLITRPGKATLLKGSLAVMRGNLVDKPWVVSRQVKSIRFEAPNRDLFQMDGDVIGPDANEITIEPKAIRVVVPRSSSPGIGP
jgi:diacylglycerol kinase (ATP)